MKVRVASRKFFLERKGTSEEEKIFSEWNVISICTPEHLPTRFEFEEIPFSEKYRKRALVLYFHDVDYKHDKHIVLFNKSMAKKIWKFVKSTMSNGKGYLIHCTAGISRSQAVGMILNDFFNKYKENNEHDFTEYEDLYGKVRRPNTLVKSILSEEFYSHEQ